VTFTASIFKIIKLKILSRQNARQKDFDNLRVVSDVSQPPYFYRPRTPAWLHLPRPYALAQCVYKLQGREGEEEEEQLRRQEKLLAARL